MRKLLILVFFLASPLLYSEKDPFIEINKKTHQFNQSIDNAIGVPIAKGYKTITPDFLEVGISNFTSNIEDINISLNNFLQGKFKDGLSDLLRFFINSSIGLAGMVDVASDLGLMKHDEDFGQTLAKWGVDHGPYIVLPVLGPSSLRDVVSKIPDAFLTPLLLINHHRTSYELTAVELLDRRSRYLGLEQIVIGDDYIFFRDSYFQNRNFEINDGLIEDDFIDFGFED